MPIETGLWIVMGITAAAFTFFSIKTLGKTMVAFSMISLALWMGLAVIHAGGLEVAATSSELTYNGTGALLFNQTNTQVFIPGGTQANWLGWVFFSFGIFNAFNVARLVTKL